MADDANALTHKPAEKPSDKPERLPTEADYAAIVATVTQTARGRWFLAEYARRNRNADTRMVLDAVARIEASMARTPQVADSTPTMVAALGGARRRAAELLNTGRASREIVQQHVQALREITWTLREWGTDNALCDRLDAHANAIAETPLAPDAGTILAIFDELQRGAGSTSTSSAPPPPPEAVPPAPDITPPGNIDAAVAVLKPQTLGAVLLTQGLVASPRNPDALAPLRRMTQAEKVALFT
jgi:hypothetical protein